jgi:hypothetical protein
MTMRHAWQLNMAVIAVMTLALLGGWETYQGITQGTPLAWAVEAEDGDKDKDKDKEGFDHFACYEVYPYNKDKDKYEADKDTDKAIVTLFNQFTKDKDGKDEEQWVKVGKLKLLCVPTKKAHHE